ALEAERDDHVRAVLHRDADRHRVGQEAVDEEPAVDLPRLADVRDRDRSADRVHDRPLREDVLLAAVEVGRGQVERDVRLFERSLSESNPKAVQDQAIVHETEALPEREDLGQHRAEQRGIVPPLRELARPEPAGDLFRGPDVDAEGDERGIHAAAAATDDQVHSDAFAVQHLLETQSRRALDAPGADDERDAPVRGRRRPGGNQAGKLATAESTSGKTWRMLVNPERSRTLSTSGRAAAGRRSPPCFRASLTVSSSARSPALDM